MVEAVAFCMDAGQEEEDGEEDEDDGVGNTQGSHCLLIPGNYRIDKAEKADYGSEQDHGRDVHDPQVVGETCRNRADEYCSERGGIFWFLVPDGPDDEKNRLYQRGIR